MQRYLSDGGELKGFVSSTKNIIYSQIPNTKVSIPPYQNEAMIVDLNIIKMEESSKSGLPKNAKRPVLNRDLGITSILDLVEYPNIDNKHSISFETTPAAYSDEVYNLYVKYQIAIHRDAIDELTEEKFVQFLVDSPLQLSAPYGTFHQKYYLDGLLIAVAVLDVLPNCISSVYFLYDPAYADLSLGTYSALREIAMTVRLSQKYPSIQYYYLGKIISQL